MKPFRLFAIIFALALLCASVQARETITSTDLTVTSGSVTLTKSVEVSGTGVYASYTGLILYSLNWTSDASGNVVATINDMDGTLVRAVTVPSDGATSPTANYDVTFSDSDGIDLLSGLGANRSQSTAENIPCMQVHVYDSASSTTLMAQPVIAGPAALAISNAGDEMKGVLKIYMKKD